MMRFATVCVNSWSREAKRIVPEKEINPLLRAVIDSRSRWSVGSSKMSTFAPESIMRESMQRTRSPPESTSARFWLSSPEKSIRPRKPRTNVSSGSLEYWRSQSTRLSLTPSK